MQNGNYVISLARKLGATIFLVADDIVQVGPTSDFLLLHPPLCCGRATMATCPGWESNVMEDGVGLYKNKIMSQSCCKSLSSLASSQVF